LAPKLGLELYCYCGSAIFDELAEKGGGLSLKSLMLVGSSNEFPV